MQAMTVCTASDPLIFGFAFRFLPQTAERLEVGVYSGLIPSAMRCSTKRPSTRDLEMCLFQSKPGGGRENQEDCHSAHCRTSNDHKNPLSKPKSQQQQPPPLLPPPPPLSATKDKKAGSS